MFSAIEELQVKLGGIHSVKDFEPILKTLAEDCGFPRFLLAWTRRSSGSSRLFDHTKLITNFPEEWMARYFTRRYYEDDCILNRCLHDVLPVVWNNEAKRQPLTTRQRRIACEAAKYGLALGISVPVHGSGGRFTVFCLSRFRSNGTNPVDTVNFIQLATAHIHSSLWCLISDPIFEVNTLNEIKPVEADCLMWSARGQTSKEIGKILSISERTVYFHVSNAMERLNCRNRKHAISLAIQKGFIQP